MSSESKVVLATGGTLLIAILMFAAFAISDHRDIRAEMRFESSRLDQRLLALESRVHEGFHAVDQRFLALEQRFDARFTDLEGRMDTRFAQMDTRFVRVEQRLDRVLEALGARAADAGASGPPEDEPGENDAGDDRDVALTSDSGMRTRSLAPGDTLMQIPGTDFVLVSSPPVPSTGWKTTN